MAAVEEPYNALTRALFAARRHAAGANEAPTALASVSESGHGARLELMLQVLDDRLEACRYRVFGCPHLVAAAEWWCDLSEGQPPAILRQFDAAACMQALAIPVEKTGRVLLLEDAIRSLADQVLTG